MKSFFTLFTIFISLTATCQLHKKTWLVGGSGTFNSYNEEYTSLNLNTDSKYTDIQLSGNVGYFVVDKLSAGVSILYSYYKGKVEDQGDVFRPTKFAIGPHIRYYFLNNTKPYNILADIRYQFGINKYPTSYDQKGNLNIYSIMVGPEIFFNSAVGLEILLGYSSSKENTKGDIPGYELIRKGFQTSIGFQIHLEKL